MKINDQTLPEIFEQIPWPYKIVIVVGVCFIIFVIGRLSYMALLREPAPPKRSVVSIASDEKDFGRLDPSIATHEQIIMMSYTEIGGGDESKDFETRISLAVSRSKCRDWNKIQGGIPSYADELIGPDEITPVKEGAWRVETPSLVYDPNDKGREWKLYAYKYFWGGTPGLARLYGMIILRTASNPLANSWSDEEWVFSASPTSPPLPYSRHIKAHLSTLDPSLADVYFYARPSVVVANNVLLMSLSAFVQGKESPDRVVLLGSMDHGRNWAYLGTPIRHSDLSKMGDFSRLSGGTLFMQGGKAYLSVVLGNAASDGLGTFVLDFESIANGQLRRDTKTDSITVLRHIPTTAQPPSLVGGGQIAYNEICPQNMIMSESNTTTGRYDLYRVPHAPLPHEK